MNRWRTQWEEEMSEKNAVAAELLTLRSEFEKSSGTYDKEIEELKDMLDQVPARSVCRLPLERLVLHELRDHAPLVPRV